MKKTELYIKSTNNENNLHTIVWEPEGDIESIFVAIVYPAIIDDPNVFTII